MNKIGIVICTAALFAAGSAFAASTDSDDGSNGYGGWTVGLTSGDSNLNGSFIGDSTENGGAGGPGSSLGIGGTAWALYANSGQTADAVRSLVGGPLVVGDIFSIDFDNGNINAGATVGFGMQNAGGDNLFEVFYTGGDSFFTFNDSSGANMGTTGFTTDGLNFSFQLTGAAAYSATLGTEFRTGSLIANGDQAIAQIRVFNFNAGNGDANNIFFNNYGVSAVPEPSTAWLFGLGAVAFAIRRKIG